MSQGRLDVKGIAEVIAPLDMPKQRGPESILCDVQVTDVSRQAVAQRAQVIVHPG